MSYFPCISMLGCGHAAPRTLNAGRCPCLFPQYLSSAEFLAALPTSFAGYAAVQPYTCAKASLSNPANFRHELRCCAVVVFVRLSPANNGYEGFSQHLRGRC